MKKIENKILNYCFAILILLSLFHVSVVNADTTIKLVDCEYTEQYKEWLNLPSNQKKNILPPTKCKTSDTFFTSVGSSVKETYQSSKFDLRDYDYVTKVKNQEKTGLCWTFATFAAMESNLLLNGNGAHDFSEAHLGFSAQKSGLMPSNREYSEGGNYPLSSAYLFNRMGPVLESDMPWSTMMNSVNTKILPTVSELSSKNIPYTVRSTSMLNSDQGKCSNASIESIKKYLVSKGAIAARMFFDYGKVQSIENGEIKSNTVNGEYYYYDGSSYSTTNGLVPSNADSNHAVTIIGWDDSVAASNFSTAPSRNGAWIIKNSYGTTLNVDGVELKAGDEGYYYVSYDDINVCTNVVGFYDITSEKEDNAYYHDTLGFNSGFNLKEDTYVANVFNRKQSVAEKLKSVSFFSYVINQKYDILVSVDGNLSNAKFITSGVTDKIGYFTININDVILSNSKYGIIIKYYYNSTSKNTVATYGYNSSLEPIYSMDVSLGYSFISYDGKEWKNLTLSDGKGNSVNVLSTIRAYTNNLDYTLKETSTNIDDKNVVVFYDYNKIDDISKVTYNIYDIKDTSYKNKLNDKFDIDNKFKDEKKIIISLNDKSTKGDYVLLVEYKDLKVITKFSVFMDKNNQLGFKEMEESNNSPDVKVEIEDNPANKGAGSINSSYHSNATENPKTGLSDYIIIALIAVVALGVALIANSKIAKNNIKKS